MLAHTVRISGIKDGSHEDFFDINGKFFESFINSDVTNCEIKIVFSQVNIPFHLNQVLPLIIQIYIFVIIFII